MRLSFFPVLIRYTLKIILFSWNLGAGIFKFTGLPDYFVQSGIRTTLPPTLTPTSIRRSNTATQTSESIRMRAADRLKMLWVLGTTILLAACGGGGGGSGGITAGSGTSAQSFNENAPKVQVTGKASFASVPNNATTGALDYAATSQKPVRGATIEAISGTTVLSTSTTSDQGAYTLNVPAGSTFFLRLRAELVNTQGPATWNIAVRDNTAGSALWAVDGVPAAVGNTNTERSIAAGSGWGTSSYTSARSAGPFAILDTIYSGVQLVTSVQSTAQFAALTVFWSPKNIAAGSGAATVESVARGEIGTTFFTSNAQDPARTTDVFRSIFVLGQQDNDTDEYDSSVVAHEFGHYLESAFGKSNSLGGPHSAGNKLEATVAFSEGWGNAWSAMARANPIYTDSAGPGQGRSTLFSLLTSPADAARGWYREDSVDTSLYKFFTGQRFAPIWAALTGPARASQDALLTIFSFAAAVRSAGDSAATSALNTLLSAQSIFTGADQWGAGETNNGGRADNLPLYSPLALGTPVQTCFTAANLTADSVSNKLGSARYYLVTLPSAGQRTITANFPAARDLDFEVFQKGVTRVRAAGLVSQSESASVSLEAGVAVIRVIDFNLDFNLTAVPANTPCGTLVIN
jgi:hypothetical protein